MHTSPKPCAPSPKRAAPLQLPLWQNCYISRLNLKPSLVDIVEHITGRLMFDVNELDGGIVLGSCAADF